MVELIDHIGIAVRSLEERIPFYRDVLKLGQPEIETVTDQMVRTAVFILGARAAVGTDRRGRIELLEPMSPESPIAKFIAKNGEGIHHVALRTPDLNESIANIQAAELRVIDEKPRDGAGGTEIAFVHPKSTGGVLLELCRR